MFLGIFWKRGMGKKCTPWSDAAERGVWSGSTLFANHPAVLDKSTGSKMDLFKFKEKYGKELKCQNNTS